MDYPNDADGDALRRVANDGSDMSKPMEIDFAISAPSEDSANAIAYVAQARGYRTKVCCDADDEDEDAATTWSCYCTRTMVATYREVTRAQVELDAISRPLGGHADGWGTFGNATTPAPLAIGGLPVTIRAVGVLRGRVGARSRRLLRRGGRGGRPNPRGGAAHGWFLDMMAGGSADEHGRLGS